MKLAKLLNGTLSFQYYYCCVKGLIRWGVSDQGFCDVIHYTQ